MADRCLVAIEKYCCCLRELQKQLEQQEPRWHAVWRTIESATQALTCPTCQQDEVFHGARVLGLLSEVRQRWDDVSHPCHFDLLKNLAVRLCAPQEGCQTFPVTALRFSQNSHSDVFRHGAHAGKDVNWLVGELDVGRISTTDKSMVVHAVFFHGHIRVLNNRHSAALVRHQDHQTAAVMCQVRLWHLTRGVCLDDGSQRDVVDKFLDAFDSRSDGRSIRMRSRSCSVPRSMSRTRVPEMFLVHIQNIDYSLTAEDVRAHILSAGHQRLVNVEVPQRYTGSTQLHNEGHALASFDSARAARELVESGLQALRGRLPVLKLDVATSVVPTVGRKQPGGFLRCKACRSVCGELMDIFLLEGVRPEGYGYAPAEANGNAYYLTCAEKDTNNCVFQDHPQSASMPFKLMLVFCSYCGGDLGNIQDSSLTMSDEWCERLGKRVMCFKCKTVLLELADCSTHLVDAKKWSILYSLLEFGDCRMSTVTLEPLARKLGSRSRVDSRTVVKVSNRDVRLIPIH